MDKFTVITGTTYEVEAENEEQALAKFYAYFWNNEDCPCGLPQWAENASAEGQDLCECVEQGEVVTEIWS